MLCWAEDDWSINYKTAEAKTNWPPRQSYRNMNTKNTSTTNITIRMITHFVKCRVSDTFLHGLCVRNMLCYNYRQCSGDPSTPGWGDDPIVSGIADTAYRSGT
jgi:hypothetical protein